MIQFKRGNAEDFKIKNPVLAAGQPGFEKDTGKLKIGNGQSAWNSLKYINDEKALLEKLYPIGSIQIMSTNTNPGDSLGGTWELIDKGFANSFYEYTTSSYTSINGENFSYNSTITRANHSVEIQFTLTRNMVFYVLSGSAFKILNYESEELGIDFDKIPEGFSNIAITDTLPTSASGGSTTIEFNLKTGELLGYDVIPESFDHTKITNTLKFKFSISMPTESMLDNVCDKFYFKRIA